MYNILNKCNINLTKFAKFCSLFNFISNKLRTHIEFYFVAIFYHILSEFAQLTFSQKSIKKRKKLFTTN